MKKRDLFSSIRQVVFLCGVSFCVSAWALPPEDIPYPEAVSDLSDAKQNGKEKRPSYRQDTVLVKMKSNSPVKTEGDVRRALGAVQAKKLGKFAGSGVLRRWWKLTVPRGQDINAVITRLSANPNVEAAEPDYKYNHFQTPNDPRFNELWGMHNVQQTGGVNDADIDAPEAWDKSISSHILVAVIDTGMDYNHEDLAANIWTNTGEIPGNDIDDDGNGYIDDIHGYDFFNDDSDPIGDEHYHGTHVAGTIAGVGNNNIGVTGVNWNAKVMPLKFLGPNGGYTSDAVLALDYAVAMGAQISNNSWGGSGYSSVLYDAISRANDAGHLFVAAAGNSGRNLEWSFYNAYPAEYNLPNIISVAATDHNDARAYFSNYGSTVVDLGAPGVNILSTLPTNQYPEGYGLLNGTSMATPHVTGSAALLWAKFPLMTLPEVKSQILASVDPLSSLASITVSGGRLNINNALDYFDFYATMSPAEATVVEGGSTVFTLELNSSSNEDKTINLSLDSLPDGITATLADTSVLLQAGGTVSTTLSVDTTESVVARGMNLIKVILIDSLNNATAAVGQLKVLVPNISIAPSPSYQAINQNEQATYTITVDSVDGYTGDVVFSAVSSEQSIQTSFNPAAITLPAGGSDSTVLTVVTQSNTPLQTHNISITAVSGQKTATTTVQLEVKEIDLTVSSLASTQTAVDAGSAFVVTDSTDNNGVSTAEGIKVGLYLSDDAVITTDDQLLGYRVINELMGYQSDSGVSTVNIPASTQPGAYYIGAIADHQNEIVEINEVNNSIAGPSIQVTVDPGPCCNYGATLFTLSARSGVRAVNDSGKVVGVTPPAQSGPSKGFYWTEETGQVSYGYYHSGANTINNAGDVGGYAGGSNRWWSTVVWPSTGGVVSLAGTGYIYGLSENDMAAGSVLSTPRVWTVSTREMTIIPTLGGSYGAAMEVNNNGLVVGYSHTEAGQYHAFTYDTVTGELKDIGATGSNTTSFAVDVNDIGQVVGYSGYDAFVYTDATGMQVLPGLAAGKRSAASAINNNQQIIGYSYDANNNKIPVMWFNGQVYNLNDYIDPSSGLLFTAAVDISENGTIVGAGAVDGASTFALLNPLPAADVCPSGCDFSSIQAAINAASSGDTITVGPGSYNESISLSNNLNLVSQFGAESTIINATGLGHSAVYLGHATIDGFTITGGLSSSGGGINVSGNGTVINSIVTNNSATGNGGGLMLSSGSAVVSNNLFSGNDAVGGGAISYSGYTTITIEGNTFTANSATNGGALLTAAYASSSINANVFDSNTATTGGAIYASSYSSPTISNALIVNNYAGSGAGIYIPGYAYVNLVNSTVVDNDGVGVGVAQYSGATVSSTIAWGNSGGNISQPYYDPPMVVYSIVGGGYAGTGNQDIDPMFADAINGDYHLSGSSTGIDTGANTGVTSDLDGNTRPLDGDDVGAGSTGDGSDYDIGAYEF